MLSCRVDDTAPQQMPADMSEPVNRHTRLHLPPHTEDVIICSPKQQFTSRCQPVSQHYTHDMASDTLESRTCTSQHISSLSSNHTAKLSPLSPQVTTNNTVSSSPHHTVSSSTHNTVSPCTHHSLYEDASANHISQSQTSVQISSSVHQQIHPVGHQSSIGLFHRSLPWRCSSPPDVTQSSYAPWWSSYDVTKSSRASWRSPSLSTPQCLLRLGLLLLLVNPALCVRDFAFFNATSSITISPDTWDFRDRKLITFKTCSDNGTLLSMRGTSSSSSSSSSSGVEEVRIKLSQGEVQFSWSVRGTSGVERIAARVDNNKWHTVEVKYYLGVISLQVLQNQQVNTSVTIANSTLNQFLLDTRWVSCGDVRVGNWVDWPQVDKAGTFKD